MVRKRILVNRGESIRGRIIMETRKKERRIHFDVSNPNYCIYILFHDYSYLFVLNN